MDKSKNELIARRRRKIRIKRTFFLIVLLTATLITLCLKLPYFKIQNVVVKNNKTIATSEIIKEAGNVNGINIFYINISKIKNSLLNNPYVLNVDIKRKLPNTVEISISERAAAFFSEKNNKFMVIDKNGVVLEERDNLDNLKLIKLEGFDTNKAKVGKVLPCDDSRKIDEISIVTDLILKNSNLKGITRVDITDATNLKIYYNDMCIKLGTYENLANKLNEAINIINDKNLASAKGYVDVSFNGNPVFFVQK